MAYIRIIPCLDVHEGRVVKGIQFADLRDAGDPVENARRYSDAGADELAMLDISATLEGRDTMLELVTRVADAIDIPLTIGGGIRSLADAQRLIAAGATRVSINSAAVKRPELIREIAEGCGPDAVILAVDAAWLDDEGRYEVVIAGGTEGSGLEVADWARQGEALGAAAILLTSRDRDGSRSGYDNRLNRLVSDAVSIPVIASGGAGKIEDFRDAVIEGGVDAVLAASLFHFGEIEIPALRAYLDALDA